MIQLALRVLVIGLATYRIARALTRDSITEPFRHVLWSRAFVALPDPTSEDGYAVNRRSRIFAWLYGLMSCPYCAGFWIALGLYWAWTEGAWQRTAIAAVAVAGVQAALTAREPA